MIEQKLQNYFKHFTAVTPRSEFVTRSRGAVTDFPQFAPLQPTWLTRCKEALTTGSALALASFLLLIVLGSISYISKNTNQVAATAFNNDALVREATQLSFNVQLKDAEYFDESASQVVQALNRLSGDTGAIQ